MQNFRGKIMKFLKMVTFALLISNIGKQRVGKQWVKGPFETPCGSHELTRQQRDILRMHHYRHFI
jgi:hypothetical protein